MHTAGLGGVESATLVTIPKVPSPPINNCLRSYPL